jgi:hypothetical protein
MEFQHVNAKIFVEGELPFDPSRFINVFHEWIQESALPELLIDVADYCHVPDGPGVLLVAHEADYSMDHTDGRWGMRYNRKAPLAGSNEARYSQAFSAAARACSLLEKHFAAEGPLRFSRNEFEVFINDRALAQNKPEINKVFQSSLQSGLAKVLGHKDLTFRVPDDPRRRVGAVVKSAHPFDLEAI